MKTQKLSYETAKLARQSEDIKEEMAVLTQDKIRFDSELARVCALEIQTVSQAEDFESRFNSLQEKKKNALENAKNAQEKFEEIRDRIRIAEENLVKEQGRKESVRNRRESLSSEMSELKIKSAELAKDHESSQRELETLKSGMTDTAENLGRLSEEEKSLERVIKEKNELIEERKQQLENVKTTIETCNADIKKWQNIHREQDMYVTNLRNGMKALNDAKEKYSGEISKIDERKISAQRDYDSIIISFTRCMR